VGLIIRSRARVPSAHFTWATNLLTSRPTHQIHPPPSFTPRHTLGLRRRPLLRTSAAASHPSAPLTPTLTRQAPPLALAIRFQACSSSFSTTPPDLRANRWCRQMSTSTVRPSGGMAPFTGEDVADLAGLRFDLSTNCCGHSSV
jgi:hypothetical protein